MSVELPKVKEDFASIVGSLVDHPWKMLQFILWLDLKLAEYKVHGSMLLDLNFGSIPKWLDFDGSCKSESQYPKPPVCQDPQSNESISDRSPVPAAASQSGAALSKRVSVVLPETDADLSRLVSDGSSATSQSVAEGGLSALVSNRLATSQSVAEDGLSTHVSDRTTTSLSIAEGGLSTRVSDRTTTSQFMAEGGLSTRVGDRTTTSQFMAEGGLSTRVGDRPTTSQSMPEDGLFTRVCDRPATSQSLAEGCLSTRVSDRQTMPTQSESDPSQCVIDIPLTTPSQFVTRAYLSTSVSDYIPLNALSQSEVEQSDMSECVSDILPATPSQLLKYADTGHSKRIIVVTIDRSQNILACSKRNVLSREKTLERISEVELGSKRRIPEVQYSFVPEIPSPAKVSKIEPTTPPVSTDSIGDISSGTSISPPRNRASSPIDTNDGAAVPPTDSEPELLQWFVKKNMDNSYGIMPQRGPGNSTDLSENGSNFIPNFRIKTEPIESANISETQELHSDTSANKCPGSSDPLTPPMSEGASYAVETLLVPPPISICMKIPVEKSAEDLNCEAFRVLLPVCSDISDEDPGQMPPVCPDIPDEGPAQTPPVCPDIPDEGPAQMPLVCPDIPDEGPAQTPPLCNGFPDGEPALVLYCENISPDEPEEACHLMSVPYETSQFTARQGMASSIIISAVKTKKKITRPCPFCPKFHSKLTRHIKFVHKDQQDVQDALKLSGNAQELAFAQMRKQGIYQENLSLLKCDKPLIRERRRGKVVNGLKMCVKCKAFISAPYFFKHKKRCGLNVRRRTDVSVCVLGHILIDEIESDDFQYMLTKFSTDAVGQLCFGDEFIKTVGRSLWQKNIRTPEKKIRSVMTDMRRLAYLCLAFKDAARKDEKEVSSESMFDVMYFSYLEEAIQQVSYSEDYGVKPALMLAMGYLLKRCFRLMKAMYKGRDEVERAASIDKLEAVMKHRWTSIFEDAEYLIYRERQNTLRRRGQLPLEVEVEAIDSTSEQSLQGEKAYCSVDKTPKIPPGSTCMDAPDEDPVDILHSSDTSPDDPEEASCMESVPPVIHESSLVTARQRMDSRIISAVKTKKKVMRPCPFCHKFCTKLTRHIKTRHRDKQEVKDALHLSGNAQELAFAQMRKQGIYQQNMSLLKADKPLIRERRHKLGKFGGSVKMCCTCKAFIAVSHFFNHKNHCGKKVQKKADVPVYVLGNFLNDDSENADFQHMLTKLPTDTIGQLCFGDEFIKTVGRSLWRKSKRNPDKTLSEMRRLASLCLAFKDAARKDEKEVSSESMFDMVYFDYLEEAIQQVSASEDNCVKSSQKLPIRFFLKKCIRVMKAAYLVGDDDERAVSIDKFEADLKHRWKSVFGDAGYVFFKNTLSKRRRPIEVKVVQAVDSTIEQLLQGEQASCSVDKILEKPPDFTCMDVPDGGPTDALNCKDIISEKCGPLESLPPGNLVGRRYVHWTNAETMLLRNYFHDIIEDCSKTGLKGSLPGFREIQLFLDKHPTVLQQLEDNNKEKLKCIKAKLFNERSKQRRIFAENLKALQ